MDSSKIKAVLIAIVAMFCAIYLGIAAATAQFEAIAWVVGIGGVTFVLAMGKHVWLLVPAGLVMAGKINLIPGTPPVWALSTAIVTSIFLLRFAMRRPEFFWKPSLIDFAVLIQLVAVGQSYVRNPTGLLIMGGEMAGGKSYFEFLFAIIAFFCLSLPIVSWRLFKVAIVIMIICTIGDSMVMLLSDYIPAFGGMILPFYSNVDYNMATKGGSRDLATERGGGGMAQIGRAIALPVMMMNRPLKCLNPFHPLLSMAVLLGVVSSLLSGFRSLTSYLFVVFVVSALIRKKFLEILLVLIIGFLGLTVLAASGSLRSMPFGVQRALSFLPVEVSAAAKADAENSSEWRFEMWRLVLFTDRYIQNKWLGDGFGIKTAEMKAIFDATQGYNSSMQDSQEQHLAKGSYHGFHVETIRFTGFLGLGLAIFANFVFFASALKSIKHFRNHPDFGYVAYLTIPFLIYPFWSLLVFGSYRVEFPQILAMAGLLKMLENFRKGRMPGSSSGHTPAPIPGGAILSRTA